MLEIPAGTRRGFLYARDDEILQIFKSRLDIEPLYTELHEDLKVVVVNVSDSNALWIDNEDATPTVPCVFRCIHGIEIEHTSINILPQEGWEELVDCWSCHNCEFKTVLDLKPKPRKEGILVSDFFLLINDMDLPECCKKNTPCIRKLFYNELVLDGIPETAIIYSYLNTYFKTNASLFLEVNHKKYEIRCFYKATLVSANDDALEKQESIKVGIKETHKRFESSNNINQFYSQAICSTIMSNKIGISMLGYCISFIIKGN
ncbi:hypothetical protein HK407_05g08710 [Ordospora pajunii]|uniref:uncharacterized protein n=1 Tax=Ordospora pajunii TaxID=3039483 RepID=UPI0029526BAC|nr:uncharacterized protein HK407_05g08710 [Ordospora pajunii]KAH9411496.1 hypothetical protein HK407_05g08710 [Ordospora pajunii]